MFEIATLSYTNPESPAAFAHSLHETGFAVLTDHPIGPERMASAYASWAAFFGDEAKQDWAVKDGAQDGFFPFRSENAKDSAVKDLKEFYHVFPKGRVPPELEEETRALHADLVEVGATLLSWLQAHSPADVTARLSEPFPDMIAGSESNLLRILHYPPLAKAPEPGAVRAAAHGDINLVTCLLAGTEAGLEAKDTGGEWHAVPCDPGMMAINAGDMLDMASGGYYPATVHRVVNPPQGRNVARLSMPMFLHPRPEVTLKPDMTAGDFLTERLREIGLKS